MQLIKKQELNKIIKENFNCEFAIKHDGLYLKEAVDFWNNVFAKQEYPPKELLDYNLVKAMIYKESRIGYYKSEYYQAYPDVMQVGNTNNPALNSLRGVSGYDANEFVSKNKKDHISYNFPEEWLPVKVENPKESIFWGVRWLYNKAQKYYGAGVDYNNPPFTREWKPWEQAVIDYNGSPKKYEYQKEIWEIYKNGVDPDGNILWKKNDSGFSLIKMLIVIGLLISSSLIWLYFLVKVNNLIDNCVCAERAVLSEISRNTQYGEFNYSAEEYEFIRAIFLRDLEQYKKDRYYYGDVFKNTMDECQKSNCDLEYIIAGYYDDLVKYTRSNKQFLDAVSMFDFMQNVKVRDIDNDGENEIIFIKKDVLNNEYLAIIIIDKIENKFQIMETKVEYMAFGRIDAIDLTGDSQPEIVLLAQNYRWGERLFVYEYLDNKIIRIFQHNELVYPIYVFSDSNNNGKMEIKVDGYLYNNGHPVDKNLKDVKVYEYNIEENNFVLLK